MRRSFTVIWMTRRTRYIFSRLDCNSFMCTQLYHGKTFHFHDRICSSNCKIIHCCILCSTQGWMHASWACTVCGYVMCLCTIAVFSPGILRHVCPNMPSLLKFSTICSYFHNLRMFSTNHASVQNRSCK